MPITRLSDTYLSSLPIGSEIPWGDSTSIPAGFLKLDGSEHSRTTYAELFDHYGTTWGIGDGSTTFELPNLGLETLPWNKPRGLVGYSQSTADSGGYSGHDIAGTSVTFNQVAGRSYRVTLAFRVISPTAALTVFGHIRTGASADVKVQGQTLASGGQTTFNITYTYFASSTTQATFKGFISTSTGSVTVVGSSVNGPSYVSIEDLGADTSEMPWNEGCWIVKALEPQPTLVGAPYEVVTTSTHPVGSAGKMIYETDSKYLLVHDGEDYAKPWNMAWGLLSETFTVENVTHDTIGDVTGLSLTVEVYSGRQYKLEFDGGVFGAAATVTQGVLTFATSANLALREVFKTCTVNVDHLTASCIVRPLDSGLATYKIRIRRNLGTGSFGVYHGNLTTAARFRIYDVGPVGSAEIL